MLAKPASEAQGSNPYARLLYSEIRGLGARVDEFAPWRAISNSYDIFHLHWPEYYIAQRNPVKAYAGSIVLLALVSWCRLRGAKVIWTVHNLESHNKTRPRAEEIFWKLFTNMVDAYISLNEAGRELITRRFPATKGLPFATILHGHYRDAYPSEMDRLEARRRLGIPPDRKVFLFFGSLARYKGLTHLVEAFRSLADRDVVLCIAGAVADKSIEPFLRAESREDPRFCLQLSRVPTRAVELYFKASDVVVLPFSDIFNSGSALLALSFDRPLLVPALGGMSELQQLVGDNWVSTYEGILTADHLSRAMHWAFNAERQERAPLDQFNWGRLAADTLNLYTAVLTPQKVGAINLLKSNNMPGSLKKIGSEMDEPVTRQPQR